MTDADDGDELARITEDAEAFVDKARLRSLFDARDTAAEAIQEATLTKHRLAAKRSVAESEQLVDEHVRAAVTTYVLECEPLLQNTSTGLEYWQSYEVGPVHLPPYPPSDTAWEMGPDRTVVGVPAGLIDADRDVIEIPSIRQYVNLPSPIRLRWSGLVESPGFDRGTEDGAETTNISMPRDASEDVFRAINKLLADLGVGLDAETIEDDEASYDYSDLL
jgi:hypothetical protein